MAETSIEWCDKVWNPTTGCTKVSAGCKNCYAEKIAKRFWGERSFGDVWCHEDRLDAPLHWRKPSRIFVNSMSDLFHEAVPFEFVESVFRVMHSASRHTFLVLTKRPRRMKMFTDPNLRSDVFSAWPFDNVWLGVSAENQETADERIPLLLQTPAAHRFVSLEPLLGPVDLMKLYGPCGYYCSEEHGHVDHNREPADWVIIGGESGPRARPCNVEWIRAIVRQCKAASVPCFVKQLGANYVDEKNGIGGFSAKPDPTLVPAIKRLRHRKGSDMSEWPSDLRVREMP